MLSTIFSKRQFFVFIQGISSGLPLLLTLGTLQAWMTDVNVDLGVIGLMSSVTLPYSLKFIWAPFFDRFSLKFFGRRKGWIFVIQLCCALAIALLGLTNPLANLWYVALASLILTFFSATQDILIDAYRRDILPHNELGLGSSVSIMGYRIGMIIAGALSLKLANAFDSAANPEVWGYIYFAMAALMVLLSLTTFFAPAEDPHVHTPQSFKDAILGPFLDFLKRDGAMTILLFILLYKVGDQMASTMTTPFILKIGFTKDQLANVAKLWGMAMTIIGGFLGGVFILRLDIYKALWIFGGLQMISTYGFGLLALVGNELWALTAVIAFENLASGLGTAAYAAYMAHLTTKKFSATQYALLSALMALPRTLFSAPTGYLAKELGWHDFFLTCTLIALPGMLMLFKVAPWNGNVSEIK